MRKFFNKNTYIIISIVSVIFLVCTAGVYLSTLKVEQKNKEVEYVKKNSKDFFSKKQIDYANSTNAKFNIHKYRNLGLYMLTNWVSATFVESVTFNDALVKKNLINYCQTLIKNNVLFIDNNDLYINAKYSLVSSNELIIDVRWANKISLINNIDTTLYWNKFMLNIKELV